MQTGTVVTYATKMGSGPGSVQSDNAAGRDRVPEKDSGAAGVAGTPVTTCYAAQQQYAAGARENGTC